MSDIDKAFERINGRTPTAEEKAAFLSASEALGVGTNDAIWVLLFSWQRSQTELFEKVRKQGRGLSNFILVLLVAGVGFGAFFLGREQNKASEAFASEKAVAKAEKKVLTRSAFYPDPGDLGRTASYSSAEILAERLKGAKTSVSWYTSYTNKEALIRALSDAQKATGASLLIATEGENGGDIESKLFDVKNVTFGRINSNLEKPYSVILIDGKIAIDVTKDYWTWETSDMDIINKIREWSQGILRNKPDAK